LNLLHLGQLDEAIEHLSAAVALRPKELSAEYHLGVAYQRQGRLDQAAAHYASTVKRKPDFVEGLVGLASIRASAKQPDLRNVEEAVRLAQKACELTHFQNAESLAMLATAYAQSGRDSEAAATSRRALDAARKTGDEKTLRAIQKNFRFQERTGGTP
jgi:Flp pilus assembly protein TadD